MGQRAFLCGNEAVAEGVRLSAPHVIAAYPITPQTVVVERLAEMVEDGSVKAEFMHVESEHSALSASMGASAVGARTFSSTSSQGLVYMAECLHYASGGRFPIVMMNANRSLALPWSIYGDHRDSMSLLDCGWIQVYTEDAQESLDMVLQAYAIAEHPEVLTPVMINLDGFVLTHTYELVDIPDWEQAREFLPPYETVNKLDFDAPKNMAFSSNPGNNLEFKLRQHRGMLRAKELIAETDGRFQSIFGRSYGGLTEAYRCDDAELIVVSVGSVTGTCRTVADELRNEGWKVGVLKIRFMRPFPEEEIIAALRNVKAVAVLDKDISFGYEGTVFTNVNSALSKAGAEILKLNFIGGLGGRDISKDHIREMYRRLQDGLDGIAQENVQYLGLGVAIDERG
ncbi:transketolase C-terminal domain-containing protein [Paenibacillus rhizophilus]|uniref:Pyruvate ferredoxin oxidoreductase n=1 Tax=Paenibacillus rhizophilus TaxID=1850366 RepID=A0A3N9PDL3_9BACL|nr:transketolase C-terminal domain-containing protein [Paenibacillus rhizophilus]RQW13705.1 pyruvate ferredoxin oxidoreductase [Paenibacillus rhizophilus]